MLKINNLKSKIIDLLKDDSISVEEGYYAIADIYSMVTNEYNRAIARENQSESTEEEASPMLDMLSVMSQMGGAPMMPPMENNEEEAEVVEEKEEEKE